MNAPVIQINHVSKIYGDASGKAYALRDVAFSIRAGEYVAIIGPSGSGKSTLMNILGCLDRPDEGTYLFDGRDVSSLSENDLARIRNKKIGFVFQAFNLLPRTSAIRNVALPLVYGGVDDHEREERATSVLTRLGLGTKLSSPPSKLSGGQQQRVAIARAIINHPLIVLADEPTGNLDTKTSSEIMKIFDELNQEGATIIMITHELEIAQRAKRIIKLLDGEIVSDSRKKSVTTYDGLKKKG